MKINICYSLLKNIIFCYKKTATATFGTFHLGEANKINANKSIKNFAALGLIYLLLNADYIYCDTLSNGLVLKYAFNGNAVDISGGSNNGTLWGGATYGSDRFGNLNGALAVNTFNGAISENNLGITGNSSYTISIWIKPTSDPVWPNGQLVHLGAEDANAPSGTCMSLTYDPYHASEDWVSYGLFSLILDGNGPGYAVTTDPLSTLNSWSQIVATYDSPSGTYNIYLNGRLQNNNFIQWNNPTLNLTDGRLRINAKPLPEGLARGLDGLIDDLSIYNRALSGAEVLELYNTEADWQYAIVDGNATITHYLGAGGAVLIPSELNGLPVRKVGKAWLDGQVYTWPTIFGLNNSTITSITIPNSVTTISDGAFSYLPNLTSVILGNNITNIGQYAFQECYKLENISLPTNLSKIGFAAFRLCTKIKEITVPRTVNKIEDYAFLNCSILDNVVIQNGVGAIGVGAFEGCSNLKLVYIPTSVTNNDPSAFPSTTMFLNQKNIIGILNNTEAFNVVSSDSNIIASVKNNNNLYTTNQIHNLGLGGIVLNRNANNQLTLSYQVLQSSDLQNWAPYQNITLPITNAPSDKMFLRVQAVGP